MFITYVFDGNGRYLAPWICEPDTTAADIKAYAALYLKVRPRRVKLYAPDVSGTKEVLDTTVFDESVMPTMEGWKWIIVSAATASMPDDDEPRFEPGVSLNPNRISTRL